jgi:hypothetical protein
MGILQNQINYRRLRMRRNAVVKGVLGRDRGWLFVFVMILVGRQANRVLKRGAMPVLFSEKLEPGHSYVITHYAEPSRRKKK